VLSPSSVLVGKERDSRSSRRNNIENIIIDGWSYASHGETARYSSKAGMRALRSRG
jgi:hypothetical protein